MRKETAERQSDNNTDPDLSAKAHNHTQHMWTCADKHWQMRLCEHENMCVQLGSQFNHRHKTCSYRDIRNDKGHMNCVHNPSSTVRLRLCCSDLHPTVYVHNIYGYRICVS